MLLLPVGSELGFKFEEDVVEGCTWSVSKISFLDIEGFDSRGTHVMKNLIFVLSIRREGINIPNFTPPKPQVYSYM